MKSRVLKEHVQIWNSFCLTGCMKNECDRPMLTGQCYDTSKSDRYIDPNKLWKMNSTLIVVQIVDQLLESINRILWKACLVKITLKNSCMSWRYINSYVLNKILNPHLVCNRKWTKNVSEQDLSIMWMC